MIFSNIINHILLIIATLSNSNTKSWLYKVPTHGEDLLKILIIAFVIYQLLYEEEKEVINIESNNNVDIQSNDFNNFSNITNTNGPKFINLQLEELNARIENKQVINNSLQNNQTINKTIQNNINQPNTYIQNNQNSQINQNVQNQYNNKL